MKKQPYDGPYFTAAMQAWMGGYEPVLAARDLASKYRHCSALGKANASKQRTAQAESKKGWGNGTIDGMGKNA
jgi:hypothetical protein